jgi:hypothetical protein
MMVSRIFRSVVWKYQNRLVLANSRCFLSTLSPAEIKTDETNNSLNESISIYSTNSIDNNEWLWAYLRQQKLFSDLNEEQRRRVLEIG